MQASYQRQGVYVQTRTHGSLIGGRRHLHLRLANGRKHEIDLQARLLAAFGGHPTPFFVVWKHPLVSSSNATVSNVSNKGLRAISNKSLSFCRAFSKNG